MNAFGITCSTIPYAPYAQKENVMPKGRSNVIPIVKAQSQ